MNLLLLLVVELSKGVSRRVRWNSLRTTRAWFHAGLTREPLIYSITVLLIVTALNLIMNSLALWGKMSFFWIIVMMMMMIPFPLTTFSPPVFTARNILIRGQTSSCTGNFLVLFSIIILKFLISYKLKFKTCGLNEGKGIWVIWIVRGERAFCSRECRYEGILMDEGMDYLEAEDRYAI